jgi:hypothetical protein
MLKQCTLCGSDRIIPDVIVLDKNRGFDEQLNVIYYRKPQALFFRDSMHGTLRAWICGVCGHVELFVGNPGELYQAYLDALENQRQRGESGG